MGKLNKNAKPENTNKKRNNNKNAKPVKKNSPIRKPEIRLKRLLMFKRRLKATEAERNALEEKNKLLTEHLNAQKLLLANKRKDAFLWERKYHEVSISLNSHKVKQAELAQALSTCVRECDASFPRLVAFSDSLVNNKMRLTSLFNKLRSEEYECLPRHSGTLGNDSAKRSEKTKHRVGPMVRGLLITKPKIMLERLMLPQPQDQVPENNAMSTIDDVTNQLTTIPEEDDQEEEVPANLRLKHASMRFKSKLGTSWRVRRQDHLENDKKREREREKISSAVAYGGDSSDSESNPADLEHMEPVVRFRDVSRLLQNSSLIKVDANQTGGGDSAGISRSPQVEDRRPCSITVRRSSDDPLEGSSWMFNTNSQPAQNKEPNSSLWKSNSSDDDDDDDDDYNIPLHIKDQSNLSSDTLAASNCTFTKHRKRSLLSSRCSGGVSSDSSLTVEADSSINSDIKNSSENVSSSNTSLTSLNHSINMSTGVNIVKQSHQSGQQFSINASKLTVQVSKMSDAARLSASNRKESTTLAKRSSSFCDNCSPFQSPSQLPLKRLRKPKNQLYPGEEEVKMSPAKSRSKKRPSFPVAQNKASKKSESANSIRKSVNKKSSVKKSWQTPSSAGDENNDTQGSNDGSARPRRLKTSICYKEQPINTKKRRE